MLFIGIAFIGVFAFSKLGIDLLPNINLPHLIVQTSYPNSSPEEIEQLVTEPLESVIGTVTGVKKITSISKGVISIISIDFVWGTNMDMALLSLREKLDNIRFLLPNEAGRPTIIRADPLASPIISLALSYRRQRVEGRNQRVEGRNQKLEVRRQKAEGRNDKGEGVNFLSRSFNFVDHDSPEYEIKRLTELKEAARTVFRRRIEQLDGVAQAVVTGGLEREVLIEVDSKKMSANNISFSEIERALKSSNKSMSAGSIMKGLFRYSLRTIGEFEDIEEIKHTVIKYNNGRAILLTDIADVFDNFKEREGLTRLNGAETVGLLIYKESDANTVSIAEKVKQTINTLKLEYPEFELVVVSDQSGFIVDAIENVKQEILYGGVLAVVVLFFFLGSIRNVFIIGITIPASLVLTILLMYLFEINFNIISLGGIAVGVGMLLDNAIIVIENVVRYKEQGLSIRQAALKGSSEVAMPIVTATLTTIVVFLPLVFVKGIAGELFKDQSYAIVFSLSSSIFVAVTLIPMLASRKKYFSTFDLDKNKFLKINIKKNRTVVGNLIYWVKVPIVVILKSFLFVFFSIILSVSKNLKIIFEKIYSISNKWLEIIILKYELLLEWSLNNKKTVLAMSLFLLVITAFATYDIKKEFIPPAEQDEFIVEIIYPKGTSLKGNAELTSLIENKIIAIKGVKNVVSNIGRVNEFDFLNKEQHSINKANLIVKLDSYKNYYSVQEQVKPKLNNLGITTYSIKNTKTSYSTVLQPSENDIAIKIKNDNIEEAYLTANDLINTLEESNIEDISNFRIGVEKGVPEYKLSIDEKKCNIYGINVNDVTNKITYLVKGNEVTSFSDFDKKITINLRTKENERNDINDILSKYIYKDNIKIPLKDLVDVKLTHAFNEIWREEQSRTIHIYADVTNIGIDEAVERIRDKFDSIPKKQGETISIGGTNEEINSSFSQLYIALLISMFLMYMILAMEFESFVFPFIIIVAVPLGLIGGVLSLYLLSESISIISIMGLIILVGIADNDAVVKVEFILRKRKEGFGVREAIIQAGRDRFRPIVMNSLTVMFALIPMIIGVGAGTQLRISLSIAIAGGLFSATFLTLIIVPVLYTYMEKWSKKEF